MNEWSDEGIYTVSGGCMGTVLYLVDDEYLYETSVLCVVYVLVQYCVWWMIRYSTVCCDGRYRTLTLMLEESRHITAMMESRSCPRLLNQ